jgi:hypothetical protein
LQIDTSHLNNIASYLEELDSVHRSEAFSRNIVDLGRLNVDNPRNLYDLARHFDDPDHYFDDVFRHFDDVSETRKHHRSGRKMLRNTVKKGIFTVHLILLEGKDWLTLYWFDKGWVGCESALVNFETINANR